LDSGFLCFRCVSGFALAWFCCVWLSAKGLVTAFRSGKKGVREVVAVGFVSALLRNVGRSERKLRLSVWLINRKKRGFDREKRGVYLRFLNSCIPSIVVVYWNPASISLVASFAVVAPATVYSSSV